MSSPYLVQQLARTRLLGEIGQLGLHVKYPDEFEYYLCALELVNPATKETLMYFVFPIMPSSEEFSKSFLANTRLTAGGSITVMSPIFEPFEFQLDGSFGRDFKWVAGETATNLVSGFASKKTFEEKFTYFNDKVKTGYACHKMLEKIILESMVLDDNGLRHLYFYNQAFNQRYIVQVVNMRFRQDVNTNMIWNYSLTLRAIAPLANFITDEQNYSLSLNLAADSIIQTVGKRVSTIISL